MKTLEDVLEEITPTPDPDFAAEMERRMQQGFPPRRRPRFRRLPRIAPLSLRPRAAAAVAASAALALLVTVSVLGGDGERATERPLADGAGVDATSAPEELAPAVPQPDDPAALRRIRPPRDDLAPGAGTRRVERSAQLVLASDPDDFDTVADGVFRIAERHDGFVMRSSLTQGEDGAPGGSFALRIPVAQLGQALNELSRLATVRSRSESGNDVTGSFVSIRDRLRAARAEQRGLLRRLERADSDAAVRALRRQLAIVERRIGALRAQLRGLRERTQYASVTVELVDGDGGATTGATRDAFDDAVGSLEAVLNFLIRALGVLIPLAVVTLLGWLAASRGRRRARERALA